MTTLVQDLMKEKPVLIASDSSLEEAAQVMESVDCGVLPVGTWDKLEGIITDRDIVLRAVAKGKNPSEEKVKNYMSPQVHFCNADDTLEQAAQIMHRNHVNRLVVKDASGKACGILSFGCILRKNSSLREINQVLECTVGQKAA